MPLPAASVKGALLNLSGRGQASLIHELGSKTNDTDTLLAAIERHRAGHNLDRTRWQRRIVFSVENRSTGPADRISTARIRLDELTPPALFQSWTEFATKYDSVDLGTLRMTEHRELVGTAGHATGSNATARESQDREESVKLSERYVSLTGALSTNSAELIQQGAPGIDLTGNVAVDLTVRVPNPKQTDVFRFSGAEVARHTIQYTASPRDIEARATLTATIRKVLKGDRTLVESDDRVEFRTGVSQPLRVLLVPAEEQIVHVWILRHPSGAALHFARASQTAELIQLDSFESALALKVFLSKTLTVGGRPLVLPPSDISLDAAHAVALQVEIETLNPPR